MEKRKIREVKIGEYLTLKPEEFPKENIVWVRGEYNHSSKMYSLYKFSDVNHERFVKGDKECYVDFIF